MTTPTSLTAREITEPGAYEWLDADGILYVGFIRLDSRGRLSGSFIAEAGHVRAMAVLYSDNHYCEGTFFGPMSLHEATDRGNALSALVAASNPISS